MNKNDKYYIKTLVDNSLEIFMNDGYLHGEELREFVIDILKMEKKNKLNLCDCILDKFSNTEQYRQIKDNKVKICSGCNKVLPETNFRKKGKERRYLSHICKVCQNKLVLEYRHKNREKVRDMNRNYYYSIKDDEEKYAVYIEKVRERRIKNKERYNATNRKSRLKKFLNSKLGRSVDIDELEKAFELKENGMQNKDVLEVIYKIS